MKSKIHHHEKLNMHYVTVPAKEIKRLDGQFQRGRFNKRVIIQIENLEWQAGIVALGEGEGYITLSKARMKKLGLVFGETVEFSLKPDESEYGMEMAEEFAEILKQDPEANQRFMQLKKSVQRYMLYHVIQVKSSEARLKRSLLLLENLKKLPVGMEDFRRILGKE